jgi:hypothetical protein
MLIFLQGTFTLLVHAYAGRTKCMQSDLRLLSPFLSKP